MLTDEAVRFFVYDHIMSAGLPPTVEQTGLELSRTLDEVKTCFQSLAEKHMLVLQRKTGEILMANPFSAVPTPFLVQVGNRLYYGNCIWDALGIPAMLGKDALIRTSCGCCGTAMSLSIENGALQPATGVVQFALPVSRWGDNIVFT
jgi:hypothetical protein